MGQNKFSKNLILYRNNNKLSQQNVADLLEIDRSRYAHYEAGTLPTLDMANKIIELLKKDNKNSYIWDDIEIAPNYRKLLNDRSDYGILELYDYNEYETDNDDNNIEINEYPNNKDEFDLICDFHTLTPEQRAEIKMMINIFKDENVQDTLDLDFDEFI